ncbi:nucleotidyltransferase family protein [Paenibacillus hemerocallicola]|uniref:Nucleotidyltransferase family protein n=1 Tax=Paenibacillus hemerocallicola TaxID=1172614 RepID=A0A5C4T7K2_9BACL|nr:nucleotidyltransferase family protein [Paenibacillus hemerocallicola]TNJ64367.1 nucleotidyltransferase family protein [Paenibacillus hemerocallicola]
MEIELALEERLILKLIKLDMTDEEVEECRRLMSEGAVDWGRMIHLAVMHKVTMIMYRNVIEKNIFNVEGKWKNILNTYLAGNRIRNEMIYRHIYPVLSELSEIDVTCILLKGALLNHTLYDDFGLRHSNDVDLLVSEDALTVTEKIFEKHGFIQGQINWETRKLEPATRKQKAFQRMSTHELMPFILEKNESFCKFVEVDVHFDIFSRAKRMRANFPIAELFKSAKKITINGNIECYSLKPEYNLMQLASHLYQDATMIQSISRGKDIELIKFVDLNEFIRRNIHEINWGVFAEQLVEFRINPIVYYAIYYTEQIFGELVPRSFMNSICPPDQEYLNMFAFEEEHQHVWQQPFFERMFNFDRKEALKDIKKDESLKYISILKELKAK